MPHKNRVEVVELNYRKRILGYSIFYVCVFAVLIVASFATNHVTDVLSKSRLSDYRQCIVLDAGHGGVDGGAISCTGARESVINLEICIRLQDLFHLLGYDTKMIRTDDVSIHTQGDTIASKKVSDLKERVRIINETENALLISIHQNHFQESRYHGAQIFYNSNKHSEELAGQIQAAFVRTVNAGSNRKAKKSSGVYLMEHVSCCAVLVECGFLSNPAEEAMLRDANYQKSICCVIASSVSNFLDVETND